MVRLSSHKMRCLELALVVTLLNLVISFSVVYLSSSPASSASSSSVQDRLLLSVEYPGSGESNTIPPTPPSLPPTPSLDPSVGVLDKYRKFKSHMFHYRGEEWGALSHTRHLCLGAQSSLDRLDQLVELASTWSGPMSISVFAPAQELPLAQRYIDYLRQCQTAIARQVSFHLVYPVEHPPHTSPHLVGQSMSCSEPRAVLDSLLATRGEDILAWRHSYPYPQNLLRNLAKSGCQTNYTYIPDIDMVPPPGLDLELEKFLQESEERGDCDKCAYVVPTYEIAKDAPRLPVNKTELIQMVKDKQARQFHQALYSINQKSSNLKHWESLPQTDHIAVAYKVEKYIFKYEPLYIARADTPQFDERFIGFGMTRNSQVYEMYVAGYSFHLLNNAFTSHWGFQSIASRPGWRARQQEQNNARFDEFAKEVSAHYSADPYNMLEQLKKMNLKHVKVAYGVQSKKSTNETKTETKT